MKNRPCCDVFTSHQIAGWLLPGLCSLRRAGVHSPNLTSRVLAFVNPRNGFFVASLGLAPLLAPCAPTLSVATASRQPCAFLMWPEPHGASTMAQS